MTAESSLLGCFQAHTIGGMSKPTNTQPPAVQSDVVLLQEMPNGGGSDYTLKKNIIDLPPALEKILALRPVSWNWKDRASGAEQQYGFIAQEIEEVMPDLVYYDTWTDGTKRKFIKTKELLAYLTAAMKEQQTQIDRLEAKIQSLRSQNE